MVKSMTPKQRFNGWQVGHKLIQSTSTRLAIAPAEEFSALLSLRADIPVRKGGSSGGLYSEEVFSGWKEFVPFDLSIPREKSLRLLVGNIGFMQREHIAYIGREDGLAQVAPRAESEARQSGAPLTIKIVEGDHFSSLAPAISAFVETVRFE
jgi:hypothetical protein